MPTGAGVEQRVDVSGQRRAQRDSAPDAEPAAELQQPVVMGLQQWRRLGPRQPFDAERAGDRQQSAIDAVAREQLKPRVRIVLALVKRVFGLVAQAQHPAAAGAAQQRRLAAPCQRGDERLRPEVLVDIEVRHGRHNTHKLDQVCRD